MKVKMGDREVEGEQISFVAESEPFGSIVLEDGARVRCKMVVTRVIKTTEKDSQGEIVYQFQTQPIFILDKK